MRKEKIIRNEDTKIILRRLEEFAELLLLSAVYFLIWMKFYNHETSHLYGINGNAVLVLLYVTITAIIIHMNDGFKFGYLKLSEVIISQVIAILLSNFITYWQLGLMSGHLVSVFPMILLSIIDILIALTVCYVSTRIYHSYKVPLNMLMIIGNTKSLSLKNKMEKRAEKYHISKVVSADVPFNHLIKIIPDYDAVIIADIEAEKRNDLLKWCYANTIRTYLTPKISDVIESGSQNINLFDTPLQLVKGTGITLGNRIAKRVMDILLSLIALVITSPIMILVSIMIKLEDNGPVFFKQKRATINGKEFWILKFRSMIVNAEKNGEVIPTTDNDSRITKTGKIIRACRIDELPQIINILKGDMSIVGPRPERIEHVKKYTEEIPEFQLRLKVKGGLTGMAQIYGKYNTTPLDKLKLDLMYIENYSILLDLKLIIQTVRILFEKESTEGFDKNEQADDIEISEMLVDKDVI